MTKQATIFRGPCGVGKTTLRQQLYPNTPCINYGLAPRFEGVGARILWAQKELDTHKHFPHITIEGIFAPGSITYRRLLHNLRQLNFNIHTITLNAPLTTLLTRIGNDPSRAYLAKLYHSRFT